MTNAMTELLREDIRLLDNLVRDLARVHEDNIVLINISKKIVADQNKMVHLVRDDLWRSGDIIPANEIEQVIDLRDITPEIRLCIHENRDYHVSQEADVYNLFSWFYRYITDEHIPIQMLYSRSKRAEYMIKKRYAGSSDIIINHLLGLIYSCLQLNNQSRPFNALKILETDDYKNLIRVGVNNQT